ncbi:MAG: hypothetical protein AAF234_13530 [Pseudomonadota bacterium]
MAADANSVIHPDNLIHKLSYAYFGSADASALEQLKALLQQKNREFRAQGKPFASRQTINNWFGGTPPTKLGAIQFILQLVTDEVTPKKQSSEEEQRKTLNMIRKYCRKNGQKPKNRTIHVNENGSLSIKAEAIFSRKQYIDEIPYISGHYRAFKPRFRSTSDDEVSSEIIKIYAIDGGLYADWWFLVDGKTLSKFEGAVMFVDKWLYVFCYSPKVEGRLRVFCTNRTGWGRRINDFDAGVLTSTSPDHSDPSPVSCSVFIEKMTDPIGESGIASLVKHHDINDIEHDQIDLIRRTLDPEGNNSIRAAEHLIGSAT